MSGSTFDGVNHGESNGLQAERLVKMDGHSSPDGCVHTSTSHLKGTGLPSSWICAVFSVKPYSKYWVWSAAASGSPSCFPSLLLCFPPSPLPLFSVFPPPPPFFLSSLLSFPSPFFLLPSFSLFSSSSVLEPVVCLVGGMHRCTLEAD